jgi:hypothetical protein
MSSISRNARVAGVLYLLLGIAAPLRLLYIPSTLFVRGDPAATAANIAANETLFTLGIVSELFCGVVVALLTLALYRLFKDVDRQQAVVMVVLGGILPAAIDFIVVLNDAAALILVRGPDFLSAFDKPQRDALAMLFLRLHGQQVLAAEILWGLWLFPLAVLILRSGYLPRLLGYWLMLNGIAYLAISLTGLLLPSYESLVSTVTLPAVLGEVAVILWLVIMGATPRPSAAEAA